MGGGHKSFLLEIPTQHLFSFVLGVFFLLLNGFYVILFLPIISLFISQHFVHFSPFFFFFFFFLVFQFNISLKVNPPEILCFSHSRDSYFVSMCSPVLKAFLKSAKVCTFPLVVQIAPCFNLLCSTKLG